MWHGGELYYLGRSDGQVKLRGQRLELSEVESAVATVHGVAQAAVAVKEVGGDKALVAYCVPTPGADPQAIPEEVLTATKAVLPAFMVPSFVLVVPELPMTRNGKLDASALPSPTPQAVSTIADATPAERRVLQAFSEVLGTPVADVDANFFALGGSSLSAVTVAVALDGVHIADVFAHPTARSLAQLIDAPSAGDAGFAEVITLHEHHGGTPVLHHPGAYAGGSGVSRGRVWVPGTGHSSRVGARHQHHGFRRPDLRTRYRFHGVLAGRIGGLVGGWRAGS